MLAPQPTGWLRLLCLLLVVWEPLAFAAAAAGAFNAITVRGAPIVLVLLARLVATALCVAAGLSLQHGRTSAPTLARVAVLLSAVVQLFALTTSYFPSNRPPDQTSLIVAGTLVYYGGWLIYLSSSKQVRAMTSR